MAAPGVYRLKVLDRKPAGFCVLKVSIKIKKHTDEAVWIRIAWGDRSSRPNHLKPTYVVHHLQTPYVFVTNLTPKRLPLLTQVRPMTSPETVAMLSNATRCVCGRCHDN